MPNEFTFYYSTKVMSGNGVLKAIGSEIKAHACQKALIITDQVIAKSEALQIIRDSLEQAGVEYNVYAEVEPDPTVESIEAACAILQEHRCDCVIGLGGGSPMDAAKGAAIRATNAAPISQYEGANKIPNAPLPVFAVPTTAGTGSEVSQSSILTDGPVKRSIRSAMAAPKIAFLDPSCVATVPPSVAVSAGLDALAHNMESYLSLWSSPMSECFSATGIRLVAQNLRQYVANPKNLVAAGNMQLAALLGAASFLNSRVGLPHALGMALGGVIHIPHGLACGLALAPCMEYSWIGNPKKYRDIAEFMGENTAGMSDKVAAEAAIRAVVELIHSLDTQIALSCYGVGDEHVEPLAQEMIRAGLQLTDPRTSTVEDAKAIVSNAMHYDL